MTNFVTHFVTHFLRCDAAEGGLRRKCGPKYEGRIVCDAPKATRSRFVTHFVTQALWRTLAEAEARLPIAPRATADA